MKWVTETKFVERDIKTDKGTEI